MSWPADSSTSEEEEEEQKEQEQEDEQEEVDPKPPITDAELEQGKENQEGEQEQSGWWHSQDWEVVMGEQEQLAFDDRQSDSNTTADGHSPRHLTPVSRGHQWRWQWRCM